MNFIINFKLFEKIRSYEEVDLVEVGKQLNETILDMTPLYVGRLKRYFNEITNVTTYKYFDIWRIDITEGPHFVVFSNKEAGTTTAISGIGWVLDTSEEDFKEIAQISISLHQNDYFLCTFYLNDIEKHYWCDQFDGLMECLNDNIYHFGKI